MQRKSKRKTTRQVKTDSKETVTPVHITAAKQICKGSDDSADQIFDDGSISPNKKSARRKRKNTPKNAPREGQISKEKALIVEKDVHYSSPATGKRRNTSQQELPMEQRLENLLIKNTESKLPKSNNLAQLLTQGLQGNDTTVLQTVFTQNDQQLIKNTVKRIPVADVLPLIVELSKYIQGTLTARKIGVSWMKYLVLEHGTLLMSNPDLSPVLGELLANIEALQALQVPRIKLMGRLELLASQIKNQKEQDESAILVFNDKRESDSDVSEMEFDLYSNSGNEEESDEGDVVEDKEELEDDDEQMSSDS